MPIVVNSNTTATVASFNLSRANDALRTSLSRLSSGQRITNPADDAGGLSVANKLSSKLTRTEAVRQNVQNGISYLQVQDGALKTVASLVDRMAELRTMASDVTKNTGDIENYSKEFIELQKQMNQVYNEKFNGISLFSMSRSQRITNPPDLRPTLDKNDGISDSSGRVYQTFSRNIFTTADGVRQEGNVSLNVINLQYILSIGGVDTTYINSTTKSIIDAQKADGSVASNNDTNGQRIFMNLGNVNGGNSDDFTDGAGTALANGIGAGTFTAQDVADAKDQVYTSDNFFQSIMLVSMSSFTDIIERVADARAENGAEQNRLGMVNELLTQNQTNLEAAYGRIMDADIALESTRYARQNVLVQSSAAMVAQANQLTNIALAILG